MFSVRSWVVLVVVPGYVTVESEFTARRAGGSPGRFGLFLPLQPLC